MTSDLPNSGSSDLPSHGQRPSEEGLLHAYLDRFDAPCPVCSYNLRKLIGDICPECGQRFALEVGTINAPILPLVALLAPMFLMLGLAVSFSVFCLALGPPGSRERALVFLTMAAGYCQAPVIVWIIRRARGNRLPGRGWLAGLAVVASLVYGGFIIYTASHM